MKILKQENLKELTEKVLDYKCDTSFVKGLEYNLLHEFEEQIGKLPELNVMKK